MSGRSLTKAELVDRLRSRMGLSRRDCSAVVNDIFDVIRDRLTSGEDAKLTGLGTFSVRETPERHVRNPQTGELMAIPAHRTVRFKPGRRVRAALREKD